MKEITLLVADDHPLFRQGVVDALSLEKDFDVIAQASNGEEAIDKIRALKPMVAVLDVNMPGKNGQQVTHQVASDHLPTRVVLLTGYDDIEQAIHAVLAGATGYCAKEIEPDVLARTIRAVAEGKYAIAGNIFNRRELDAWIDEQMEGARRSYSEPGSPFHPLSDREMEVLSCVVRGMSNKEIANLLGISHQTVKNHVTSILRKFSVEDRTQAVVYALQRGWVKLQDTAIKSQE
ncbi:MAG TPA: response regulator transcription factor [Anaerolineales bacterium]|nr:response regulator transcription factor [Anaerolineales bacterium]